MQRPVARKQDEGCAGPQTMDIAAPIDIISAAGSQGLFRWRNFRAVDMRGVRKQFGLRSGATTAAAAIAFIALLWCEPRRRLKQGCTSCAAGSACSRPAWMNSPPNSRAKGIKAEAIGHLSWKSTVSKIVKDRASGKGFALVLVGHSQGANNVIEMAQMLETQKIAVDLLVTLAPMLQDPVPANVVRAMNYYQNPGWGAPLVSRPRLPWQAFQHRCQLGPDHHPYQHRQERPGPGGNCARDPRHPAAKGEPAAREDAPPPGR